MVSCTQIDCVVIGSGVGGLTTAALLSRSVAFTVGGRVLAWITASHDIW
jgi:hypothetical protein